MNHNLKIIMLSIAVLCIATILPNDTYGSGEKLVVMTWAGAWGDSFRKVCDNFEKAEGIKVEFYIQSSSVDGMSKLLAMKDNITVDVWTVGIGQAKVAAQTGLLARIDENMIPNLKNIPETTRSESYVAWYFVPQGMFYRKDLCPFEIKTWKDLWDPRLEKKVAVPHATFSSSNFLLIINRVYGGKNEYDMHPAFEAIKKLKSNAACIYNTDSQSIKYLEMGEAAIAGLSGLPNIYKLLGPDSKFKFVFPYDNFILGHDYIAIPKSGKEKLASKLVNYMLSTSAQELHTGNIGTIPSNRSAKVPEKVKEIKVDMSKEIPRDLDYINKQRPEWIDRFDRIMK